MLLDTFGFSMLSEDWLSEDSRGRYLLLFLAYRSEGAFVGQCSLLIIGCRYSPGVPGDSPVGHKHLRKALRMAQGGKKQ